VFNEHVVNPDGSLTVNAGHEYLLGPTAVGDLIFGQSVCGVTAVAPTTTTTVAPTTSTTAGPAATTTTAPPGTTTTSTTSTATSTTVPAATTTSAAAPATTTTTIVQVGGGAFGYFSSVSLFGGPAATKGPAPTVTLPAGGSASPVTATAASSAIGYGPVQIFSSGSLNLSTQGSPVGGSVTSSARIASVGPGPFTADLVSSTCTADASGAHGSTTIANGMLAVSTDANGDPAMTVPVPANPAPNDTITGMITNVGDSFKYVFNEQVVHADGSITVNAGHEYLLGPTAKGDLIFGQVRCARTAVAASGTGTPTLALTGADVRRWLLLALLLVTAGVAVRRAAALRGRTRRGHVRR
jgi:hypothetical protein